MSGSLQLRTERPEDAAAIHDLTQTAFAAMPYSDGREGPIVDQLRRDGDLALSLVGSTADQLVAHIAFSPVRFDDPASARQKAGQQTGQQAKQNAGQWYALGPVSVLPALQGRGFGRQIIEHGLRLMRAEIGAEGIVLIGSPSLYGRFGFENAPELTYGDLDGKYIQALRFEAPMPRGEIRFAPAFESS